MAISTKKPTWVEIVLSEKNYLRCALVTRFFFANNLGKIAPKAKPESNALVSNGLHNTKHWRAFGFPRSLEEAICEVSIAVCLDGATINHKTLRDLDCTANGGECWWGVGNTAAETQHS